MVSMMKLSKVCGGEDPGGCDAYLAAIVGSPLAMKTIALVVGKNGVSSALPLLMLLWQSC